MTKICINRAETYDEAVVKEAVFKALEELNIKEKLNPQMKVALKPNLLLARNPSASATTHPTVIRAVALWLRKQGIEDITLIDSPGGPYVMPHLNAVYSACGMRQNADILTINEDLSWQATPTQEGFVVSSFNILKPILEADYVINLAKLKTHSITKMSGGIKNLFGTIPGLQKPEFHLRFPAIPGFSNMLVELAQTVNPDLTIIDAIESMEGEGPNSGTTKKTGLIFASEDIFTQDYVAAGFMGLEPDSVDMLRIAKSKGLIAEVPEIVGDGLEKNEKFLLPKAFGGMFLNGAPVFIKAPLELLAGKLLKPLPVLEEAKCIGCGKCVENCPPSIIYMENRKPVFAQKKKCISCFCCQEMCPAKAITVRRRLKY